MSIKNKILRRFLGEQTIRAIDFDLMRGRTRRRTRHYTAPTAPFNGLHLGCGLRRLEGWLNVDLDNSDWNVDLSAGSLPFSNDAFHTILCQHTIEHLAMTSELLPLLTECVRVLHHGGKAWFSCPDIEKICKSYVNDRCLTLIRARRERHFKGESTWSLDKETGLAETPSSYMMNSLFHQQGEHRNLFDFELLKWLLKQAGFSDVEVHEESEMLAQLRNVPPRNDGEQTLLVSAVK